MAFPGTFNINYYKGDTYEFNVYPKTTDGAVFSMQGYESTRFTISPVRGTDSYVATNLSSTLAIGTSSERRTIVVNGDISKVRVGMLLVRISGNGSFGADARVIEVNGQNITASVDHTASGSIVFAIDERYEGFSTFSDNRDFVRCAITPTVAAFLDAKKQYVYDVQIQDSASPYDKVFTLLTGGINITEEVAIAPQAVVSVPVVIPNNVSNLTVTESNQIGTFTVDWDAPTTGDAPTSYKIYGKVDPLVTEYQLLTTINAPTTIYSASTVLGSPLAGGLEYDVKVTSVNAAGESSGSETSFTAKVASLPATDLVLSEPVSLNIYGSWTPPSTGVPPTGYNVYGKVVGFTDYILLTESPIETAFFAADSFNGQSLLPATYGFKITSVNAQGENVTDVLEGTVTLDGIADE
jgi:hypothetical protein